MLNIEVVYCPRPGQCERVQLTLAGGASVQDALAASGLCQRHGLVPESVEAGIWGRKQPLQSELPKQQQSQPRGKTSTPAPVNHQLVNLCAYLCDKSAPLAIPVIRKTR